MNTETIYIIQLIEKIFGIGVANSAQERYEHINKHGFSLQLDAEYYQNGELVQAAEFCLGKNEWPANWSLHFKNKISAKCNIDKYKVASAFLCSEIDRLALMKEV